MSKSLLQGAVVAIALLSTLLLSACTPGVTVADTDAPDTSAPLITSAAPAPSIPPQGVSSGTPSAALGPIEDSGARHRATGTAETLADGSVRYTVAADDAAVEICTRFSLSGLELKRAAGKDDGGCGAWLDAGEVVTLTRESSTSLPTP